MRSIYLQFTKEGRRLLNCVEVGGLEREVDALAGADALEVSALIAGNVVVADVQVCQRPHGGDSVANSDNP